MGGEGGQSSERNNIIYGQEYFKNLEKVAKIGGKNEGKFKILEKIFKIKALKLSFLFIF